MNFSVEPVYVSDEHARHIERFTGYPYDPEESARLRAWARFKHWHWQQMRDRDGHKTAVRVRGARKDKANGRSGGVRASGSKQKTATIIPFPVRSVGRDR